MGRTGGDVEEMGGRLRRVAVVEVLDERAEVEVELEVQVHRRRTLARRIRRGLDKFKEQLWNSEKR